MLFTLEALPAAEGDCLLLHWGTKKKPRFALIDGGPAGVYANALRQRLEDIVFNRKLPRLDLELVMVSHMDNDHIVGIKSLLGALRNEIANHTPPAKRLIRVRRLWHNVFNDIVGDGPDKYYDTLTASVQASVGGKTNPALVDDLAKKFEERQGEDEEQALHDAEAVAAVLAGHGEGRDVRAHYDYLHDQNQIATLNSPFTNNAGAPTLITLEKTPKPKPVAGLNVTIVGPMQEQIDRLQKEFDDYLEKHQLSVEAVLAAYADPSVKNLSSIVCLVEFSGKRILLTGDARGDFILEGLQRQKLLDENGEIHVDILKVPHHGSDRNVKREFFEAVIADTYVLSGDGKHGNPERDTIQWIAEARGQAAKYNIVLTYGVADIDPLRKADFEKNQKRKPEPERKKWSHAKHSLAALFKKTTADGYKFTLQTGAPVTIDLGDETVDY